MDAEDDDVSAQDAGSEASKEYELRSIYERWADAEQPGAAEMLKPPIGGLLPEITADRRDESNDPGYPGT